MPKISRHLSSGEIQAYQDHSLNEADRLGVETHLSVCAGCQRLVDEASARNQSIQGYFQKLDDTISNPKLRNPQAAFSTFEGRLGKIMEEQSMKKKNIFTRLPRGVWIGLAVCAALVGALAFEPARTLASEFLALFRVEQVNIIQIDSGDLPQKLENSSQLEYILSNEVQVEETGEAQEVASLEEARLLVDFQVRLPTQTDVQPVFMVQPAGKLDFNVNLELVRGVLKDIERDDIQLPDELDGAHIRVEIPSSLAAYYGTCDIEMGKEPVDPDDPQPKEPGWKNCITLMQIPSPQISAPPDLDLNKIGEAYLQVLGMDPQEAASFASNVNWTTTFVVPIPRYSVEYEEVQVAGTKGTLFADKDGYDPHYLLLWIKDGVIFVLGGWGDQQEALQIANSIP